MQTPADTLTEKQLSARWRITPKCLQARRQRGQGPAYMKIGNRVRYRLAVIEEYEHAAERVPEAA
jgi:hypothetical protein